ncbi:hypothetical protein CEK25_012487 [Fusarium fujikuroi]|nr:hypothetical protein CEK25_012487 [Fusarium fujikuroi]
MTFTHTFDVAKFAGCKPWTVPRLPGARLMYCYGEKTTWNKAEVATGKTFTVPTLPVSKFDVYYDPPKKNKGWLLNSLSTRNARSSSRRCWKVSWHSGGDVLDQVNMPKTRL